MNNVITSHPKITAKYVVIRDGLVVRGWNGETAERALSVLKPATDELLYLLVGQQEDKLPVILDENFR